MDTHFLLNGEIVCGISLAEDPEFFSHPSSGITCDECGHDNKTAAHQRTFVLSGRGELCEVCDRDRRVVANPERILSKISLEDLKKEIKRRTGI